MDACVAGANRRADDRHLAVGMQSGQLSVKTRQTGVEAAKDTARRARNAAYDAIDPGNTLNIVLSA